MFEFKKTSDNDINTDLCEKVTYAFQKRTPLKISAGNSKEFYGHKVEGETLSLSEHRGIIDYRPSELVITARSGTKLSTIEKTLSDNNQLLAFEPPRHTPNATLGGSIACALSGPRRIFSGAARDFVLGTTIINGKGELLKFGGQVMKNVAGYDASRLMVGAQGTLGVLSEISVKVLPKAEKEVTVSHEVNFTEAQQLLHKWILAGHPLSASCYYNNRLFIRLSSTRNSVRHSIRVIGGDNDADPMLWIHLQHQIHPFFKYTYPNSKILWRVSIPPSTPLFNKNDTQLIEWNGALRWIWSDDDMYRIAKKYRGHATYYPINSDPVTRSKPVFQELPGNLLALHQRLKKSFDPENILNPGRIYPDL